MKARRSTSDYWKTYWPLILWLEDLDRIVAYCKEYSANVVIQTKDHEFESILELSQFYKGRPITQLEIASHSPFMSLELNPSDAKLYVNGRGEKVSAGFFHELDHLLSSRQRKLGRFYSLWGPALLGLACWATVFWPPLLSVDDRIKTYLPLAACFLLVYSFWVWFIRIRRHSLIRLESRASSQSFLSRNFDQLSVAVIAALVGAAVGVAGTLITQKFSPF